MRCPLARLTVLLVLAAFHTHAAAAATWSVDDSGGADFTDIASAMAVALAGDTIEVRAGTYGPFAIMQEMAVIGVDGAAATSVIGEGMGAAQIFADATVTGLTFENVGATAVVIENSTVVMEDVVVRDSGDVTLVAGGMHISNSAVTLSNCTFNHNAAYAGGALAVDTGSTLSLTQCAFSGNASSHDGGALHVSGNVAVSASNTTYDANYSSTGSGGAVYIGAQSHLTEDHGSYADNTAYANGGSIYGYDGARIDVADTTYSDGTALYGYGGNIHLYYRGYLRATDVTFTGGLSYYDGGNVYLSYLDQESTFDRVTVRDGVAQYSSGGGMEVYYYSDVRIRDSAIVDNQAYASGGGLYLSYATRAIIERTDVSDNRTTLLNGGGLAFDAMLAASADLSITDSTFHRNVAGAQGGGIFANVPVAITISDTTVSHNVAGATSFGGGVHLRQPGSVTFTNNRVTSNAGGYGGGIYAESFPGRDIDDLWSNNIIASNQARIGGGACFVYDVQTTFVNNTVVENAASEAAGGLCASENGLDLRNNIFAYTRSGAALHLYDAESVDALVFGYNDWAENAGGDGGGMAPAIAGTNLFVDPEFLRYSANGIEDDSFLLGAESPMIDAGDPGMDDLDGTRSDIGATGGSRRVVTDTDLDGFDSNADCDDDDASVYPGAADVWYDGVDTNCDGAADDDQDADGVVLANDCDDTDASRTADCSTPDEVPAGESGGVAGADCGCQTTAPGSSAYLLFALSLLRRRYASKPSTRATPGK